MVHKLRSIMATFVLLGILGACSGDENLNLRQVRDGLQSTIAELPNSSEFNTITILSGESSDSAYGKTCYYAQANIVVGTLLKEKEALETYVSKLEAKEWILKQNDLERSRILTFGKHARISISIDGPSWKIEDDKMYQQAKNIYPTFLFVTITYILPFMEEC